MQTTAPEARATSFQLAEPLDWFQLRALLWEAVENPEMMWSEVPAFLATRCPCSVPVDEAACRRAWERLVETFSASAAEPLAGPELWSQLLYSSVHEIFPQTPVFMNLGYLGEIPELHLAPEEQPLYPFIALYRCALDGIPVSSCDVVDIGCGAGGGCWHMLRSLNPRSVTGVDLVAANIAAADGMFCDDRLRFIRASADRIPLPDDSVDVAVSVESSHSYRSFPDFLAEVKRVLRPRGWFALADHRPIGPDWGESRTIDSLESDLKAASLAVVRRRDITAGVVASSEALAEFKEQMLAHASLSHLERAHLHEILHCRGSENHRKLSEGHWSYCCFTIRKEQ